MATAKKLPSGTWRCIVYVGKDANGKKKYKSITDYDKRKCERKAAEYADQHRVIRRGATFEKALEKFIESKRTTLSPSTIRGYLAIERYIKANEPGFYAMRINEIDTAQCQQFIDRMVDSGFSPKSVRNYYGLISTVMDSNGYKVGSVNFPEKVKPQLTIPDTGVVMEIIKAAAGTEMEIPIMLAAFGPLRRSEVCGLSMDDIQGNTIHVKNAIVMDDKGEYVKKGTKTFDSDRYIPMLPDVVQKIKEQGYVTKLKNPDVLTSRFERIVKKLGYKGIRYHDLRHWCASFLHAQNVPDQYIMARGGWHTDAVMKAVYRHELSSESNKWNRDIEKMFDSIRGGKAHQDAEKDNTKDNMNTEKC